MTHSQTQGAEGAGTKTGEDLREILLRAKWIGQRTTAEDYSARVVFDTQEGAYDAYRALVAVRDATPAPAATPGVPDSVRALSEAASPDWRTNGATPYILGPPIDGDNDRFEVIARGPAGCAKDHDRVRQWQADRMFAVAAVNYVRTLIAAQPAGQSTDDGTDRCEVCNKPLIAGQRVMQDVELGTVHAACCGPEREAYVKDVETGEPLRPNDPTPQGYVYEGEQPAGQERPDRKWVCNGDPAAHPAGQAGDAGADDRTDEWRRGALEAAEICRSYAATARGPSPFDDETTAEHRALAYETAAEAIERRMAEGQKLRAESCAADRSRVWSNDLGWNRKLAAWLVWFAEQQFASTHDYSARNRLRWAAEALIGADGVAAIGKPAPDSTRTGAAETELTERDIEAPIYEAFARYVGNADERPDDFRMFATGYHAVVEAMDRRVDGQVWRAAGFLDGKQKQQPDWLWFDSDDSRTSFGRWAKYAGQAPYVRADIALAARPEAPSDAGWRERIARIVCAASISKFGGPEDDEARLQTVDDRWHAYLPEADAILSFVLPSDPAPSGQAEG